jgi:hypothetical protein
LDALRSSYVLLDGVPDSAEDKGRGGQHRLAGEAPTIAAAYSDSSPQRQR